MRPEDARDEASAYLRGLTLNVDEGDSEVESPSS